MTTKKKSMQNVNAVKRKQRSREKEMVASILNTICEQRRKDVTAAKQTVRFCRLRIAMTIVAADVGLHVACLHVCSGSRRLRVDEGARARHAPLTGRKLRCRWRS